MTKRGRSRFKSCNRYRVHLPTLGPLAVVRNVLLLLARRFCAIPVTYIATACVQTMDDSRLWARSRLVLAGLLVKPVFFTVIPTRYARFRRHVRSPNTADT